MAILETLRTFMEAMSDAATAERLSMDRRFRSELRRAPERALSAFALMRAPQRSQTMREIPRSWRRRLDLTRRPVL
jgi:hypothetical protein